MTRDIFIDIETYSAASIADVGLYRYAMDPSFEILLVAYALDDEPTQIIDLANGETLPQWFIHALIQGNRITSNPCATTYRLHAHNAAFERTCFAMHLRKLGILKPDEFLNPAFWDCTMVKAARCGLPLSLKQVGQVLKLEEQKMDEGKALIQLFCTPRRTRATDAQLFGELPERVQPSEFPDKWETFKAYCVRDVDVERAIEKELAWYGVTDFEKGLYYTDQCINDRGVGVDLELAQNAVRMDSVQKARLSAEAATITGLTNPNSPSQLKAWLSDQLGVEVTDLTKSTLPDLLKLADEKDRPTVRRVLEIRAQLGKTSNAKYGAMLDTVCPDGRVRGITQFYGSRTGRWSGRLVQLQNLPQNHIEALAEARAMLKAGDYDSLDLTFGNVADTMSQLIRTAFVAGPADQVLAVCDFSAIEARVLAWMAGEDWVLDVFRKGGDIYCATASQMFHVPVEKHGANAHLRQRGKVAVLALGYQGGMGALSAMGADRLGMTEDEKRQTVDQWRKANPNITRLWRSIEDAARECVTYKATREVKTHHMTLVFTMQDNGTMTITLPSGRMICYPDAEVPTVKKWQNTGRVNTPIIEGEQKAFDVYNKIEEPGRLRFHGMNQTTHKWEWIETYGGKITENITQAIARDCLAEVMDNCEMSGFDVLFHIHDELVIAVPEAEALAKLEKIQKLFADAPKWAAGLPLKGAGYITPYYLKD